MHNITDKNVFKKCIIIITMLFITSLAFYFNNSLTKFISSSFRGDQLSDNQVKVIDANLTDLAYSDANITKVVLYKFVPDSKNKSLYKGQLLVSSISKTNDKTVVDVMPPLNSPDSTDIIQDVLLNQVHYNTFQFMQMVCNSKLDLNEYYSCERYRILKAQYKSFVSVPIHDDKTYMVIGYIVILSTVEYDNNQIQELINNSQPHLIAVRSELTN